MREPVERIRDAASALRSYVSRVEDLRLRLYREHLRTSVRRVSPLVADLAVHCSTQLIDVAREFVPPDPWPTYADRARRGASVDHWGAIAFANHQAPWRSGGGMSGRFGVRQTVGCIAPRGDDRIAFLVVGSHIEALAMLGGVGMQTGAGTASLFLPQALPDTVAATLPGRPLEDLIRHPAVDGRGYVIAKVGVARDCASQVVTFRTGLVPIELDRIDHGGRTR